MNHPEYSAAMLFDDAVFKIDDMVEVKLIVGECLVGKIHSIEKDNFSIDVSKRYDSRIYTYRYSDVKGMKMVSNPK